MTALETLGGLTDNGNGINSAGDIVGTSDLPSPGYSYHAVLYPHGGAIVDLNKTIPIGTGYTLESAIDINDSGQIICFASNPAFGGFTHSVLLTPIPEPTTFALTGMGLLALLTNRRRMRSNSAA